MSSDQRAGQIVTERPGRMAENYALSILRCAGYETVLVNAGSPKVERVVPPAGEDHAFERVVWKRRVEVCVSPTGRSVRVFVDGKEVK